MKLRHKKNQTSRLKSEQSKATVDVAIWRAELTFMIVSQHRFIRSSSDEHDRELLVQCSWRKHLVLTICWIHEYLEISNLYSCIEFYDFEMCRRFSQIDAFHMNVRVSGLKSTHLIWMSDQWEQISSKVSLNSYKHLSDVSLNISERSLVMFEKLSTMQLKKFMSKLSKKSTTRESLLYSIENFDD